MRSGSFQLHYIDTCPFVPGTAVGRTNFEPNEFQLNEVTDGPNNTVKFLGLAFVESVTTKLHTMGIEFAYSTEHVPWYEYTVNVIHTYYFEEKT